MTRELTPNGPAPARPVAVGEQFHALQSGTTFATSTGLLGASHVTTRAENIVLTDALVQATTNRLGESWTAIIHDPDEQIAKWGAPRFAPGPAPAEMQPWVRGSGDWEAARRQAQHDASREPDSARRAAALCAVHETYGDAPPSSWSTDAPEGGSAAERAYNAEQQRRTEHGIKYAAHSTSTGER